ncbi:MAG: hypothetical protein Q9225_003270 [Loekoesia sp. 1 TL-2023]
MSKRALSPASDVYTSSSIDDRSSRFIAYFSSQLSVQDLQNDRDLATATHRIVAWRKPSVQRSLSTQPIYDTGHDDDGEKYGGKTLEKVLVAANVTGAIVVARWYGGVLLGPVRFDHIRNCAIEAINKWKMRSARPAKQIKVLDDSQQRESLTAVLEERDQSISVLRDLLAQKKRTASGSQNDGKSNVKQSDYGRLPLAALQKLEHVRDATIGWILKEIEKIERAEAVKEPDSLTVKQASIPEGAEPNAGTASSAET